MAKSIDQDNPFERIKDIDYDASSALAEFTKMGVDEVKWISTGVPSFDSLTMIPRGRVTQLQAPYATGKGQPVDSIIPMADGTTKRMGDINPGDYVIGWDGKPAEVLGVYDRGELPTYKVSISGGTSLEVDGDHLWMLRRKISSRRPNTWEVFTTKELADGLWHRNQYLPLVDPVDYPEADLPIKPYTLGALLANGCFTESVNSVQLTTEDSEIVERVRNDGYDAVARNGVNKGLQWGIHGVIGLIKDLGIYGLYSHQKYIPRQYLKSSIEQRKALLAGLLDGDGSVGSHNSILYHTTSDQLRRDVSELVYSLGGTVSVTYDKRREHWCASIHITLPFNPFLLSRKKDKAIPKGRCIRRITSVEKTGKTKQIRCIWVDGPKNLYVASENYIVTHNTTLALNMVAGLRDKKVFYVDSEASLNPELLIALKLNPANFTLYNKSAFLEDIYEAIKEAAEDGSYDMIIFDSLAACTTKTEAEDNIANANIGQKAKMVNKMMRVLPILLAKNDTALVIINQEREVIGGYVPQKYTPGGMAVPYAASLMISLKTMKSWRFGRTTKDTQAGNFIGHFIEATIIKSKVNTPWRKAKFKLYYPQPREEEDNESDS